MALTEESCAITGNFLIVKLPLPLFIATIEDGKLNEISVARNFRTIENDCIIYDNCAKNMSYRPLLLLRHPKWLITCLIDSKIYYL